MSNELNRTRQLLADGFIAALQEEKLPWQQPWVVSAPGFGAHHNPISKTRYRGINAAFLWQTAIEKGYQDPRWCTFNQAKEKGWAVIKGEHGVPIEFWSMYDRKEKKKYTSWEAQKIIQKDPEKAKDIFACSSTYTVFNGSQLNGIEPFPVREYTSPEYTNTLLEKFTKSYLANENIRFYPTAGNASYSPTNDSISMPPKESFIGELEYYDTLLHECAHSTGHLSRLNRNLTEQSNVKEYALEELRAEIAGAFLLSATRAEIPKEVSDNNKAYIQGWIRAVKDDPNALFRAIKDANIICDFAAERGQLEQLLSATDPEPRMDFTTELNHYLAGKASPFNTLKVCDTPAILQNVGLQPLPMLITQHHLQDILHPKSKENPHWHGLTLEQMKNLPQLLQEPAIILNSLSKEDSIIALLDDLDQDKLPLIVSIVPNGSGIYELQRIDSNFITSIYGKDHFADANKGKESFLTLAAARQSLLYVNKKRSSALFQKMGLSFPQYLIEFTSAAQKKNQDPQSYSELQLLRANAVFGSDNSIRQPTEKSNKSSEKTGSTSGSSEYIDMGPVKAVPITKLAEDMGYTLVKRENAKYSLKEHDSLIIYTNTNTYYRFSEGKGGSAIDFATHMGSMSVKEAIHYLNETYVSKGMAPSLLPKQKVSSQGVVSEESQIPVEFELPEKVKGKYTRLYAYLSEARGIDSSVISDCVKRKLIYEDKRHNVVFVGFDEANEPAYATKRSTLTNSSFKAEVVGSRQDLGFFVDNGSSKLYVTEGAIDALSLMSIKGDAFNKVSYLATGGAAKEHVLFAQLNNHPEIMKVCLGNDNDKGGRAANQRMKEKLQSDFPNIEVCTAVPVGKDFNEQLLKQKNTEHDNQIKKKEVSCEQEA